VTPVAHKKMKRLQEIKDNSELNKRSKDHPITTAVDSGMKSRILGMLRDKNIILPLIVEDGIHDRTHIFNCAFNVCNEFNMVDLTVEQMYDFVWCPEHDELSGLFAIVCDKDEKLAIDIVDVKKKEYIYILNIKHDRPILSFFKSIDCIKKQINNIIRKYGKEDVKITIFKQRIGLEINDKTLIDQIIDPPAELTITIDGLLTINGAHTNLV